VSDEAKAGRGVFGEVELPEVKGFFKRASVGVRGHVYHVHVVGSNEVGGNCLGCEVTVRKWCGCDLGPSGLGAMGGRGVCQSKWEWGIED